MGREPQRPAMLEASVLETTYRRRAYTFQQITPFAPEQWLVYDDGPWPSRDWLKRDGAKTAKRQRVRAPRPPKLMGYIRLRHGCFTVNRATGTDDKDLRIGEEIYSAVLRESEPCFFDWNERCHYLSNGLMALAGIKCPLPEYHHGSAVDGK